MLPFEQKPLIKENQLYVNIHCKKETVNEVLKYYNYLHRAAAPLMEICDAFVLIRSRWTFQIAFIAASNSPKYHVNIGNKVELSNDAVYQLNAAGKLLRFRRSEIHPNL